MPLLITKAPAAACQHASMPTQDLLAQKGTSAWQTMKPSRIPTCVSDSEESDEDRELQRFFKIVGV